MRALSGFIGFKGSVDGLRWAVKSVVKVSGSTVELQLKLVALSAFAVDGIRGVAVKCLDITKNSDCEGSPPSRN